MNTETFERIEAYLANRLSAEARAAFEQELTDNSELADEVALHRLERRAMQLELHADLRQTMQAWKNEAAQTTTKQEAVVRTLRPRLGRTLAYAASVLVLVFAGTSWWATQQYSDEALALDANSVPRISRNRGTTDQLTQAQTAIGKQDYQRALTLVEGDESMNAALVRGAAYLGLDDKIEARTAYNTVLETGSTPQRELAEWQLLLIELSEGESAAVQTKLQAIIEQQPAHTYQQQAIQLQKRLNSFWRKLAW